MLCGAAVPDGAATRAAAGRLESSGGQRSSNGYDPNPDRRRRVRGLVRAAGMDPSSPGRENLNAAGRPGWAPDNLFEVEHPRRWGNTMTSEQPSYGHTVDLPGVSYEEAKTRIVGALKEQGFGILTEIDVRATLRAKLDKEFRKYVILGACNPALARRCPSCGRTRWSSSRPIQSSGRWRAKRTRSCDPLS